MAAGTLHLLAEALKGELQAPPGAVPAGVRVVPDPVTGSTRGSSSCPASCNDCQGGESSIERTRGWGSSKAKEMGWALLQLSLSLAACRVGAPQRRSYPTPKVA